MDDVCPTCGGRSPADLGPNGYCQACKPMPASDLPDLSDHERAELHALRDLRQRVIGFGGDDFTVMPWIDAHRHHADEPYIGCVFCRDQFVRREATGETVTAIDGLLRVIDGKVSESDAQTDVAFARRLSAAFSASRPSDEAP